MTEPPFIARQERFALVASTNDVVRRWLAEGTPEVCLAVADEQSAGRGREGRPWTAPPGAALLMSLGFRPSWLEPVRLWRLPATVALAMADAAEEVAGLPDGMIRLKWPNDLVIEAGGSAAVALDDLAAPEAAATLAAPSAWLKLAGVLGESEGVGTTDPHVAVGIGTNADWRASDFPPELAPGMTSLREASRGRPIDLSLLLDAFLSRLEVRITALRGGRFDLADWHARQATTGRRVRLELPNGQSEVVEAIDVDAETGALVVADPSASGGERHVAAGEIRHLRSAGAVDATDAPTPAGV